MIAKTSSTEGTASRAETPLADSGWSVLELLTLLAGRRRFVVLFTAAGAVLAICISLLLPDRYTAYASILPPQQQMSGAALLAQMGGGGGGGLAALAGMGLGIHRQVDVYVAMFGSRTVEDAMIHRFDLMKSYKTKKMSIARKVFESRSTAVAGLKDDIIRVSVEGPTPEKAAEMTNAYVDEFQKLASGVAVTEAAQRRLFFERQTEEAKDKLADAEQDLKKTELTTGMIQPENQSRAMMETAATLHGQISAKEVQIQGMSSYATDDNPEMVVLKRQLAGLREQLRQLTGSSESNSDLFVPKNKVPAAALDYIRKLREVKYREAIYDADATQYELAKLDEAKQGAIFQLIDRAVPPDTHSSPHRSILVILLTFLSFVIACCSVWARAIFRSMCEDPEDGPKVLSLLAALRGTPGQQAK